jgi:hypothetical protein
VPVWARIIPAGIGFAVFTGLGLFADLAVWTQWWFYVGLAVVLGATFVEPFFTKAQDAIVNGAAGIAAYFSASREALPELWSIYVATVIAVLTLAIFAVTLRQPSFFKSVCNQLATKAGRVVLFGSAALGLEAASRLVSNRPGGVALFVGTLILASSLSVDWTTLWKRSRAQNLESVKVVDAQSPALVVVSEIENSIEAGDGVLLGPDASQVHAAVVSILPGAGASKALLALEGDSRQYMSLLGIEVDLRVTASRPAIVGLVQAGSTPTSLLFDEIEALSIGDPLVIGLREGDSLYQVNGMRLVDESWGGSKSVVRRTSATLLGRNDHGHLRVSPELPPAHATVRRPAESITASLPSGYHRIGVVKGTNFPIGVVDDAVVSGHVAVLGMSGMGKTSLVTNICRRLGEQKFVLAVDTTGEYVQRLSFPSWEKGEFEQTGTYVYEPAGDEPSRARELVEKAMTVSRAEYVGGSAPLPRVICMEEAHTFVPEWNFCSRASNDHVNETARMVMQARKYALSFIVVTQRTAVLSKSVLSQCESYAVFRTVDDTSLGYLETVGGPIVREVVPSLARFEMLCIGPAFNSDSPVIVSVDAPESSVAQ